MAVDKNRFESASAVVKKVTITGNINATKTGHIVVINGGGDMGSGVKALANSYTAIATIPQGYRPTQSSYGFFKVGGLSDVTLLGLAKPDGEFGIYNNTNVDHSFAYGSMTYTV